MGFLLKEEKENLLIEYNLLREEVWERDYRTWVINAILIIGSLLVAFVQTADHFPTPAVSLVLVISALILHVTSERVSASAYKRIEEIAVQLRIVGLKKVQEEKFLGQWWFGVRRNIPYALSVVLTAVYLFLIFNSMYVFAIALVIGFIAIFLVETVIRKESAMDPPKIYKL